MTSLAIAAGLLCEADNAGSSTSGGGDTSGTSGTGTTEVDATTGEETTPTSGPTSGPDTTGTTDLDATTGESVDILEQLLAIEGLEVEGAQPHERSTIASGRAKSAPTRIDDECLE